MKYPAAALIFCLVAGSASAQLLTPQAQPQPTTRPVAAQVTAPSQPAAPALPPRVMEQRDIAVLQVLDKVSARVTTLRVPVGSSAAYGLIFVTARSCQVSPPSEMPEAAAFLEINEVDLRSLPRSGGNAQGGAPRAAASQRLLFSGWMFASSPALSALEHPTYDVTVLACEQRTPTPAQAAAGGEEGSPAATSSGVSATTPPAAATESAQPED